MEKNENGRHKVFGLHDNIFSRENVVIYIIYILVTYKYDDHGKMWLYILYILAIYKYYDHDLVIVMFYVY